MRLRSIFKRRAAMKWARHPNLRKRTGRASRSPVGHRLYAESEVAGCVVGLQAAELPSVDETAITDTAASPPKPKNSAFNSGSEATDRRFRMSALTVAMG